MRHRKKTLILGRKHQPLKALIRNLVVSLITHEKIVTTEAKAKALRPIIEKMITASRVEPDKELVARRHLLVITNDREASKKMLTKIAPRYKNRAGGYTRIIKLQPRAGDGAAMAQIEFVK